MAEINKLRNWVKESQWASSDWRADSWRDSEMYDGGDAQWTQADKDAAEDAGIDLVTINRTFPAVNYVLGYEVLNKFDIIAKGRTGKDTGKSQVVTEGIKFIMDQNDGPFLISEAFKDQVIPGFGCLSPCLANDPRKEQLSLKYIDWKEVWWDPFTSPWFGGLCRYVFTQRWMDLDDLIALFPEKKKVIDEKYMDLSGSSKYDYGGYYGDEAQLVEDEKRVLAGVDWAESSRKRVRPVEMWYPEYERAHFALFPDGNAIELKENMPVMEQYQAISASRHVVSSVVKKMKVCAFLDDLVLYSGATPYAHDQFPLVPFVGYVDRWGFPYGIPRQIRGQDEEINKRRSMAKALLNSRRVLAEKGAAEDDEERQTQYEEAQKLNGYVLVNNGALSGKKFILVDETTLAPSQVAILEKDEQEIREVTGQLTAGIISKSNPLSGRAIDKAEASSMAPALASLLNNLRRSLKMIGQQSVANMQAFWRYEKVLRITDSMTNTEYFKILNERVFGPDGKVIEVRNDITQGIYDLIVSEAPQTDTLREKNIELITEWVKKSPPEVIPHLILTAFELSNIPNKERLIARIKPLLGADPREDEMPPEILKQKVIQELEAQQAEQQQIAEMQKVDAQLEIVKKQAEIQKIKAEIDKMHAEADKKHADIVSTADRVIKEYRQTDIEEAKVLSDVAKTAHEISKPNQGG